jgi:MFS family permease
MQAPVQQTPTLPPPMSARIDAWLAFAVIMQGLMLASFSISALNQTKSQIETALRISDERVITGSNTYLVRSPLLFDWSTYGYVIAFLLGMPLFVWAARRFRYRNACIAALLLFGAGSLGVALSGSQVFRLTLDINWLLDWRIVQGLGGGAFLPLALALTWHLYVQPDVEPYSATFLIARSRATKTEVVVYLVVVIASLLGWLYSVKVLEAFGDWFWIPLLNVLFSLGSIVLLCNVRLAVESDEVRIDWFGWILLIVFLFFFAIALNYHPTIYSNTPRSVNEYLTP